MTFLNPILALAGLLCVGIPILIHILMRRRRKPVAWAAMRFLLEAYQQQRRRMRLEQILLLAARCLLVALIALALGRPILGQLMGGLASGPMTLYLVIDTSMASSASDGEAALERHKREARALLDQLDPAAGDRVALIEAGAPARATVLPPTPDIAAVRSLVEALTPTDSAGDMAAALALARGDAASPGAGRGVIVAISDFRQGSVDLQSAAAPAEQSATGGGTTLSLLASRPAASEASNVGIVAIEPQRSVVVAPRRGEGSALGQAPVRVGLRRSGDVSRAGESAIRLSIEGEGAPTPAGEIRVRWQPGQSEATGTGTIDPTQALGRAGAASGALVLVAAIDQDAVLGDNVMRHPIEVRSALRVGVIDRREGSRAGLERFDAGDWIRLALATAPGEIETIDIDPAALDAPRLAGLDAAILVRPDLVAEDAWRRVRAMVEQGGLAIVMPPAALTVHTWPDVMSKELGLGWALPREARVLAEPLPIAGERSIESQRDLLSLIAGELPELARAVRVSRVLAPAGAGMLSLSDGTPLVLSDSPGGAVGGAGGSAGGSGRGLVVLLTIAPALEWTDLPAKPLMVPLVQELVRQGIGRARGTWSEHAGKAPALPRGTMELRPVGSGSTVRVGGGVEPIRSAGLYRAVDERGGVRGLVAINPDPAGGRVGVQAPEAVESWLASVSGLTRGVSVAWLEPGGTVQRGEGGSLRAAPAGADASRLVLALLIAAMVLGAIELAMARWFSHATVRPASGAGGAA